jgi:hypothetical protein
VIRLTLAKARSVAMKRASIGAISLAAQSYLALFGAPGLQRKQADLDVLPQAARL